jgi:hypothetical protein
MRQRLDFLGGITIINDKLKLLQFDRLPEVLIIRSRLKEEEKKRLDYE